MKAQARRLAGAATLLGTRRPQADIRGEVAVVTGASRGLGLLSPVWPVSRPG